jgi:hypothetical protein
VAGVPVDVHLTRKFNPSGVGTGEPRHIGEVT